MKKFRLALPVLLAVLYMGCSKPVRVQDIQGEWACDSAFFYMHVKGNAIAFSGNPHKIGFPRRGGFVEDGTAYYTSADTFNIFVIRDSNAIIVQPGSIPHHDVGQLSFEHDQLFIKPGGRGIPVRLRRLTADTSIHLKKIQFSTSTCDGACTVYDMEIRPGSIIVAAPPVDQERDYSLNFKRRNVYITSISPEDFRNCERIVQQSALGEDKAIFEDRAWRGRYFPWYSLAIYFNDTVRFIKLDMLYCPPELSPLLPFLSNPLNRLHLTPYDTSFAFDTRLRLCSTLDDSLTYLNTIDSTLFRPARFPTGEGALRRYIRGKLGRYPGPSESWCFTITINSVGQIEEVVPLDTTHHIDPQFAEILKSSPAWLPALHNGHPVKTKRYFDYYNVH